jgi:signal transduction histidine kinase
MSGSLQRHELALLGRLVAGLTHEMRNALAIVSEYAGLMQDLLAALPADALAGRERFERALGSIATQLGRGEEISRRTSELAHGMDAERRGIGARELVALSVYLAQRSARLRRVDLAAESGAGGGRVAAELPARLVLAVCALLEHAIGLCGEGERIRVAAARGRGAPSLEIRLAGRDPALAPPSDPALPLLRDLQELGCRLEPLPSPQSGFTLQLPPER